MEEYYEIFRKIDEYYRNVNEKNYVYGAADIISRYLNDKGLLANDITLDVRDGSPCISYNNGTILFQGGPKEQMQISIKETNEMSSIWTMIKFPETYLENNNSNSLPSMVSYCLAEEGIFKTSYSPYIINNGERVYVPNAPLKTAFYPNDVLKEYNVDKNFDNIESKMNELFFKTPGIYYDTPFNHSLVYDTDGSQTLHYNIAAAANNSLNVESYYNEHHKNNRTSLQQKEEELTSLEKEEKTISEAEALIDQQKEGQDIGEE
ncbi:MAG: hypothetical protein IKG42_07190 [Clostridia bacterium]|nr:hypothetical protein [Clostridia bacterium]